MSRCHELCGALAPALRCALEALRIRLAALPPGHQDVADADSRVRELRMQEARAAAECDAGSA